MDTNIFIRSKVIIMDIKNNKCSITLIKDYPKLKYRNSFQITGPIGIPAPGDTRVVIQDMPTKRSGKKMHQRDTK